MKTPNSQISAFGPPRSWALVTGASDGIGKEFALQLARARYSVVLVSRTASKLDALAQQIHSLHPSISTKTFAIDFASASAADYDGLAALIHDLDIAILVNNVGVSHDIPVPFLQTPSTELEAIVTINCLATLRVTQLVGPGMVARKRGLILTMGSFAGLLPTPLLATYSGSKAFLQYWSSALGAELSPHGVTVELIQSYLVTSTMSKIRRPSALVPTPRGFVAAVLAKVGQAGGAQGWAYSSSPYWSHALAAWGLGLIGHTKEWVVKRNLDMHDATRKRALRKIERERGKKAT
jgi:17beta-estradiol 17-dehydrogenase / very-long-chain 3-oxoacyl-CoA reductase